MLIIILLISFPIAWVIYRFFVNEPPNMTGFQRLKKKLLVGTVTLIIMIPVLYILANNSNIR